MGFESQEAAESFAEAAEFRADQLREERLLEPKHTPGPWYVTDYDSALHVCRKWDANVRPGDSATFGSYLGAHIADIQYNSGVPTKEQAQANARLIVASPLLLAALEDAAKVINAMATGKLPPCFKPTLEMVNAINSALHSARG